MRARYPRGSAADGLLELGLAHARPSFDAFLLRLVVELRLGAVARAVAGALATAATRGDVVGRALALLLGLAAAGPLLVHRARGDLLGGALTAPLVLEAAFHLLVLPLALVAPCLLRHRLLLSSRFTGVVPSATPGMRFAAAR